MAVATPRSTVRLNSGARMPMLGLGCTPTDRPPRTVDAVVAAIESGYRHVDTASVYENEADVGRALRRVSIPRADVFLTTKVWNSDLGYDRTLAAFDRSLELLDVEYVDLYLIHWPLIRLRKESWKALGKLAADGRCRAIGVSNFAIKHLDEIIGETGNLPAVNQVEFNPCVNQRRLHEWCRRKDILLQTHTPIATHPRRSVKKLAEIASRYRKSPAQLMVRWALQKGVAALVRALDPVEIAEQADVFDFEISLPDIDAMDKLHSNSRVRWNPNSAP